MSFPSNHLPRITYIRFAALALTSFAGIDFSFASERAAAERTKAAKVHYTSRAFHLFSYAPNRPVRRLVAIVCIARGERARNAERPNGLFAEVA